MELISKRLKKELYIASLLLSASNKFIEKGQTKQARKYLRLASQIQAQIRLELRDIELDNPYI